MSKLKKIQSEKYEGLEKDARYLPTLYLDSKQVPEVKDWEVGKSYFVLLEIKQTSKSENDTEKDGKVNSIQSSFDIVAYKPLDSEMSDEELEEMQGKVLGGEYS